MPGECHMHIFMNGYDYRKAVRDMEEGRIEEVVRRNLEAYEKAGLTFLRDGGDHYGASKLAKKLAPDYGIDYRTPIFAIHKKGHYGKIVGKGFETLTEYRALVREAIDNGADFIKIMISGLVDFDRASLTEEALPGEEIAAMIEIAHENGMAVMAHANGDAPLWAAKAGCDSVEHGYFMSDEAIGALARAKTVYVPTIVTAGNLLGDDRFPEKQVETVLKKQSRILRQCYKAGVKIACGSDAGAYRVGHGSGYFDEQKALLDILSEHAQEDDEAQGTEQRRKEVLMHLEEGERLIRNRFKLK